MIVGLVSCYREGRLVAGTIDSLLDACEVVWAYEGPVGRPDDPADGKPSEIDYAHRTKRGAWESDAAKRQAMLSDVKATYAKRSGPLWIVWLDGDELLMNGRYLPDYLERVELEEEDKLNLVVPIVELDYSIGRTSGHIVRGDLIRRYLVSAYQVELMNGITIAFPNVPIGKSEFWTGPRAESPQLYVFPPAATAEPYIVHRSLLRPPGRTVPRLHVAEAEWFEKVVPPELGGRP